MAEKKDNKGLLALLGLLGLGGVVAWAMGGEKPSGYGASISMQILDAATGEPVPKNSPALVVEGGSYIARFTVTNLSTRLGGPVDADLTIELVGAAGPGPIAFPVPFLVLFAAGQSVSWDITFTVPDGTGGTPGAVAITVYSPTNVRLASASEPLTIESAAIIYGATITPIQVL